MMNPGTTALREAMAQAITHSAARQILQTTASSLRRLGAGQPALVNAAAQVEAIFDGLYVQPVDDGPAPKTTRSA